MTNRYCLQIALLLCFSTMALSMNYSLLQNQQKSSNLECQRILSQLNGSVLNCLSQRMNSSIPKEMKQPQQLQKEDAVLIIYEMLQQIFSIFRRNFSSTGWNQDTVAELSAELHRQMEHLETTVKEIMEKGNFTWDKRSMLKLKKYYSSLVQHLKAREYSSCAWIIVKTEILRNFFFLNRLTNYLQN